MKEGRDMALIFCPECSREISDKSEHCIHCGYPLNTLQNEEPNIENANICPKCGHIAPILICNNCGSKMINTHYPWNYYSIIIDNANPSSKEEYKKAWGKVWALEVDLRDKYTIGSAEFDEDLYYQLMAKEVANNKSRDEEIDKTVLAKTYNSYSHPIVNVNQPKCPTCGSTDIHKIGAGEKIISGAFWGLFSNKIHKTYKCGNCGYLW